MTLVAIHRESTGVTESERQARQTLAFVCRLILRLASYGFSLTREELDASYAIIRHNIRTYRSAGVVEVVKGKQLAGSAFAEAGNMAKLLRSFRGLALLHRENRSKAWK